MVDLVREVERLRLAPDEVLIVRPKSMLSRYENELLHAALRRMAQGMGWDPKQVVVLDRDVSLTIVKAEQLELTS